MNLSIILFHSFMSALASMSFCIIFNAPRKELPFCGMNGGVSWFLYEIFIFYAISSNYATFFSTLAITILARFFSYHRQAPSTLYHIAGIMPLVPGTMIYQAMISAAQNDILQTYIHLFDVFQLASMIGLGSILILLLPYSYFEIFRRK